VKMKGWPRINAHRRDLPPDSLIWQNLGIAARMGGSTELWLTYACGRRGSEADRAVCNLPYKQFVLGREMRHKRWCLFPA
jgi:hypothetical protein